MRTKTRNRHIRNGGDRRCHGIEARMNKGPRKGLALRRVEGAGLRYPVLGDQGVSGRRLFHLFLFSFLDFSQKIPIGALAHGCITTSISGFNTSLTRPYWPEPPNSAFFVPTMGMFGVPLVLWGVRLYEYKPHPYRLTAVVLTSNCA